MTRKIEDRLDRLESAVEYLKQVAQFLQAPDNLAKIAKAVATGTAPPAIWTLVRRDTTSVNRTDGQGDLLARLQALEDAEKTRDEVYAQALRDIDTSTARILVAAGVLPSAAPQPPPDFEL